MIAIQTLIHFHLTLLFAGGGAGGGDVWRGAGDGGGHGGGGGHQEGTRPRLYSRLAFPLSLDLAQCFSFNTVCKVTRYRGFDPSLNMNKIHLFLSFTNYLSLALCFSLSVPPPLPLSFMFSLFPSLKSVFL